MVGSIALYKRRTNTIVAPKPVPGRFHGADVSRTLEGKVPVIAMSNVANFAVGGRNPNAAAVSSLFQSLYNNSIGQQTFLNYLPTLA